MVYLADALKSNTTLEVIDLSFNRIENTGAKYLSETLTSHNRSLKALVWLLYLIKISKNSKKYLLKIG